MVMTHPCHGWDAGSIPAGSAKFQWSRHLMARMPASQAGHASSNLAEITIFNLVKVGGPRTMSNEKKDITLGMPHGTATNKLRKQIMFRLLQRLHENFCFRCGYEIEVIDDLSIEHKQPWEGISADLFWDEDNIAFSHLRCNRPDRPSGGRAHAKVPPIEGLCWCVPGEHFAPANHF